MFIKPKYVPLLLLFSVFWLPAGLFGQVSVSDVSYNALELRNIGPAFNGGRIADIDIHPNDESVWYVAVGSGNVWKTVNAGTTWDPIFDNEGSYSIGSITIDPNNPNTLWVGTGEDIGGRHAGFGDGIYKSTDGGNSWAAVSGDLTRNQERITLPIMGKQQSWDNPWDISAMSIYNTITSLAESPLQEGLIYAGTDDGLLQVTEDGGENWRRIELGEIRGLPSTPFVNDIKAYLFDPNTVYVAMDNHKYGDFNPYIIKSTNRGRSW